MLGVAEAPGASCATAGIASRATSANSVSRVLMPVILSKPDSAAPQTDRLDPPLTQGERVGRPARGRACQAMHHCGGGAGGACPASNIPDDIPDGTIPLNFWRYSVGILSFRNPMTCGRKAWIWSMENPLSASLLASSVPPPPAPKSLPSMPVMLPNTPGLAGGSRRFAVPRRRPVRRHRAPRR